MSILTSLRRFWARVRLAWRVFRYPTALVPPEQVTPALPEPRGPHHDVIWTDHGVRLVLTPSGNTDHRVAARIFRDIKYRKKRGLTIYYIDGRERDRCEF